MTPISLHDLVIVPTLALLGKKDSRINTFPARRLLLAIAIQESKLSARHQSGGPALSFWQIEPATAKDVLARWEPAQVWYTDVIPIINSRVLDKEMEMAILYNDSLACVLARGILWLDPKPLPSREKEAWDYYLRTWRPGKPRPGAWNKSWRASYI